MILEYLKYVETRLHEEHECSVLYLDVCIGKALVATAEKKLLDHHTHAILDKGFIFLVNVNDTLDLHRILYCSFILV
jgi:cullin-4